MSDLHEHTAYSISRFILRAADYHPIKITEPLYDKTNENNYAPIEEAGGPFSNSNTDGNPYWAEILILCM